ncbi:MAG TPA: SDR family NAD(P)-dependent oxidoreductase [Stellaceae bacterium]|nr:SDR family NAD(P)-dependent oxidoreductase [Stellaceae bacterium]HMD64618.1 SDR family NAD(P)-dependent oxidoreductase [Stellaceae bacterium]
MRVSWRLSPNGLRRVLPVMLQQKRGAIVDTASVAGLVATPGMPAYVASKHRPDQDRRR